MTLSSDIFGLRESEYISAQMALETPQIVVRWRYPDDIPELTGITLQRSLHRFPESTTEGTTVLSEAPSSVDPRTSYADTDLDPFRTYYYSLFLDYYGHFSMPLSYSRDISRLGDVRSIILETSPGVSYWILAYSEEGLPVIWNYDIEKELVTEKIDLSGILDSRERLVSIARYAVTTTRFFALVTTSRYLRFRLDAGDSEPTADSVDRSYEFISLLSPGFEVTGAQCPSSSYVAVLDASNQEVVLINTASGTHAGAVDLSGIVDIGDLVGLSYDASNTYYHVGAGKNIIAIDEAVPSPSNVDILELYPVREEITRDFFSDFTSVNEILTVNSDTSLNAYTMTDYTDYTQIEDPAVSGPNVVGLWRLDEAEGSTTLEDSSGAGNSGGTSGNVTAGADGRFDSAITLDDVDAYVDFAGAAPSFNASAGVVSVWWRAPYVGFTTTSKYLMTLNVDSSNYISIVIDSSSRVSGRYVAGGTLNNALGPVISTLSDGLWHNFQLHWYGGNVYLYIDGMIADSAAIVGSFTGTPSTFYLGYPSGSISLIGDYDELMLGDAAFTLYTRYELTTEGAHAWALSGRDYDEDGQHWRDKLIHELGEYIVRNDYEQIALPEDKTLDDGEVIFRQDKVDMIGGQLTRLSRFIGLLLDRNADRRKYFLNHLTSISCEYEFLDELGELIGASDINPQWNVDQCRRFLEVMYFCYQRGGTFDSFRRMARFLGFRLLEPGIDGDGYQLGRRFFDSVVDPYRPDVPFDTYHFDSGADDEPLATLYFRMFKQNYSSSAGATSSAATRRLTDAGASFFTDAEAGSLIIINDQSTPADNGQYLVTSILSPTLLEVDRDWPVGSLTSLQYRLHWRVPDPDPYFDQVFSRFLNFKSRWQDLAKDPA